MSAVTLCSTGFTRRWRSACIPRVFTPVEAVSPPQGQCRNFHVSTQFERRPPPPGALTSYSLFRKTTAGSIRDALVAGANAEHQDIANMPPKTVTTITESIGETSNS